MARTASPTVNDGPVPLSAMPLISPSALLRAHLSQNPPKRPSDRSPAESRSISLNLSSLTHANGSSLLRIGDTAIVCGVRAEILPIQDIANYRVKPSNFQSSVSSSGENDDDYSEIPTNHLLVPNLELSTGCSPAHLPNSPPSTEAQSLSYRLLSLLHTTRLVHPSNLKIYYDPPVDSIKMSDGETPTRQLKAYWTLYIDILCISYGGNIFDAAWLALYAALTDSLLPKAWWDADVGKVLCSAKTADARKLELNGCPVPLSWGVFRPREEVHNHAGNMGWILCDMDGFEAGCCDEEGTVAVNLSGNEGAEIVHIEKSGGGLVGAKETMELVQLAEKRAHEWQQVLKHAGKGIV